MIKYGIFARYNGEEETNTPGYFYEFEVERFLIDQLTSEEREKVCDLFSSLVEFLTGQVPSLVWFSDECPHCGDILLDENCPSCGVLL